MSGIFDKSFTKFKQSVNDIGLQDRKKAYQCGKNEGERTGYKKGYEQGKKERVSFKRYTIGVDTEFSLRIVC